MSEKLTVLLRKEAARNAQMQGDKDHQTNRRRKTFRYRNHILTAAADRIEKLETELNNRECYGEWCGKGHDCLCKACEWKAK